MADFMAFSQSPRCTLSFSKWALQGGSSTTVRMQGAPPRRSAKGPTKPIEPPAPDHRRRIFLIAVGAS
jgi:hypothetical protein